MKSYLSAEEKRNMIQVNLLHGLVDQWIETRGKYPTNDADEKEILRNLRTARTLLRKSWRKVFDNLDKSQQKAVVRSMRHLDFQIIPNDKAHKVKKRMEDFESTMVVKSSDWLDWLEMVLPLSCAVCDHDEQYKKCRIRNLLQKYNTPVVNVNAKDSCEYSYKEAGYDTDKLIDDAVDATHPKEVS